MNTIGERCQTTSVPAAAKRLGISERGAWNLVARGELPGVIRLGRRAVVSTRTLDALLGPSPDVRQQQAVADE